jgi:putative spermidine/putrescine transport system permease protein
VKRSVTLIIVGIVAFVFMTLPFLLVVMISFFKDSYISIPPSGLSFEWYGKMFQSRQLIEGLVFSLVIAILAAAGSLLVGVPAAMVLNRARFRAKAFIENVFILPLIIPTIVTGLALYIFLYEFSSIIHTRLVPSTGILILAHVLITLPWAFRLVYGGMQTMGSEVELAAIDLGDSRFGTTRRITLPLLRSSIIAAAILAFIFSFGNLEISLFLLEPGRTTLPVAMVQYAQFKIDPTIAAISTLQIVLVGALLLIINKFVDIGATFSGGTKK